MKNGKNNIVHSTHTHTHIHTVDATTIWTTKKRPVCNSHNFNFWILTLTHFFLSFGMHIIWSTIETLHVLLDRCLPFALSHFFVHILVCLQQINGTFEFTFICHREKSSRMHLFLFLSHMVNNNKPLFKTVCILLWLNTGFSKYLLIPNKSR